MTRVLLAEDDTDMRSVLSASLTKAGYFVTTAQDGMEALQLLQARNYDVLVTDVKMPRIDGVTLVKKAVDLHPELRVIFITGFAAVSLWLQSRPNSSYPVVSKPFHLKSLEKEIAKEIQMRDAAIIENAVAGVVAASKENSDADSSKEGERS